MKTNRGAAQGRAQNVRFASHPDYRKHHLPSFLGRMAVAALVCASVSAVSGGTVFGWGVSWPGQLNCAGQQGKAIAVGSQHSLLLRVDGTVAGYGAWGWWWNGNPPVTVPPGLDHVVAVAAGCYHSLALREDGTIVAWGLGDGGGTNVPRDLTNVVQIATYGYLASSSLALTADGRVVSWGTDAAPVPSGLSNIVAVSVGSGGLALKADGTIVGWGWGPEVISKLGLFTNVVAISGGYQTVLALAADGKVLSIDPWYQPPADLSNVVKIAASPGSDHHLNMALKADGRVVGWGYDFSADPQYGVPFAPSSVSNATAIASGYENNLALAGDGPPLVHASITTQQSPDGMAVAVPTKSGQVYALEYTSSLEQPEWRLLFPLQAGDGTVRLLKDPSGSERQRFYRVRSW